MQLWSTGSTHKPSPRNERNYCRSAVSPVAYPSLRCMMLFGHRLRSPLKMWNWVCLHYRTLCEVCGKYFCIWHKDKQRWLYKLMPQIFCDVPQVCKVHWCRNCKTYSNFLVKHTPIIFVSFTAYLQCRPTWDLHTFYPIFFADLWRKITNGCKCNGWKWM